MHRLDNVPELVSRSSWCEISVNPGDVCFPGQSFHVQEVKKPKDLVQIIKDNPGCHAVIDNDYWEIYIPSRSNIKKVLVSSSDTIKRLKGDTYQDGDCYGGSILLALAEIVGMTVESA